MRTNRIQSVNRNAFVLDNFWVTRGYCLDKQSNKFITEWWEVIFNMEDNTYETLKQLLFALEILSFQHGKKFVRDVV